MASKTGGAQAGDLAEAGLLGGEKQRHQHRSDGISRGQGLLEMATGGPHAQTNWTRIGVGFMMLWVLATVIKESGAFSSAMASLNVDTGSFRTSLSRSKRLEHDLMSPYASFVYNHTVIDTLEEMIHKGSAKVIGGESTDLNNIHHVRNLTRMYSTLPRTSDVQYNKLEKDKLYFMYSPSGGFNNQLICLVNAMTLARRLKRVLIVPGNGKHSNLYRGYLRLKQEELVPMDHTLDFHHMQKISDVEMLPLNVTVNEFLKGNGKVLSVIRLPPEGLMKPKKPSVWREVVSRAKRTKKQVVWMRGRFFTAHWLNKNYWENARYAGYLQELAAAVGNDYFGGNFNAFHIRMGDYATRSQKHSQDASKYLESAKQMGFPKDVPIYVASEEGRGFPYFEPLIEYFDKVVFQEDLLDHPGVRKWLIDYTMRTPSTSIRNDLFGLIEQLICSRANKFIGTRISTFSKTIRVMRGRLSAAVPDLYDELVFKKEHHANITKRLSGMHRWAGGPPQIQKDRLQ